MSTALESKLIQLKEKTLESIQIVGSTSNLEEIRLTVLGKKGELTGILKGLKELSPEDRSLVGSSANQIKNELMEALSKRQLHLKREEWMASQAAISSDVTLPGVSTGIGAIHPIQRMTDTLLNLFNRLGFSTFESNEIENDDYNFEALNIPESHPARDMHDTFYLNGGNLLRTHTSPGQIHAMKTKQAPIKIVVPGKVFRCDADISHSPVFHQIEGLYVADGVSFADLKGVLTTFLHDVFGPDRPIRFRPSYFPFTEPSLEVDIAWSINEETQDIKWLEVMGAGMVHRNVFEAVGYDCDSCSGFAFGLGVDRFAMLKYNIPDIRLLYENDVRLLDSFR